MLFQEYGFEVEIADDWPMHMLQTDRNDNLNPPVVIFEQRIDEQKPDLAADKRLRRPLHHSKPGLVSLADSLLHGHPTR